MRGFQIRIGKFPQGAVNVLGHLDEEGTCQGDSLVGVTEDHLASVSRIDVAVQMSRFSQLRDQTGSRRLGHPQLSA